MLARESDDAILDPEHNEDDLEWGIPDQDTFDEVVAEAVYAFTVGDQTRIRAMAWSSTGWDTGVGLVALTTDDLQMVEDYCKIAVSYTHLTLPTIYSV